MANIRYFSDIEAEPVELHGIFGMGNERVAERWPGVKALRMDSWTRWVGFGPDKEVRPVTRKVEFKRFPSRHECDARCRHATGRVMRCECSCGGKNHGRG